MRENGAIGVRSGDETTPMWLRAKREPVGAYAAFVVYRDQSRPRSLNILAETLDEDVDSLERCSRKWHWEERADAYTAHLDALALDDTDELIRRRREAAEQLYEIGLDVLEAGRCRLTGLSDERGNPIVHGLHPDELGASDLVRVLDLGAKLVRTATGLPIHPSGSMVVSLHELQKILGTFIELAEERMPREQHDAFVRDSYAMVQRSLGSF